MMKPRILVIVDVPGWALDRTADNVMARLKGHFSFEKAFNVDALEHLARRRHDLVYLCYWKQFVDAGLPTEIAGPCISGIRSHFKWDGGCFQPPSAEALSLMGSYRALNVPSRILQDIFKEHFSRLFYTPHGVDADLFRPGPKGPWGSAKGELVLGWAGSRNNHPGKRGLEDYLMPAIEGLEGVRLVTAAREDRWRNAREMVEWYQQLDAYICCSRTEGGPHPVLEASACAVPVISTPVGLVPELIRDRDNGLVVNRDLAEIRKAVVELRDNRELRLEMGRRARQVIEEGWTWDHRADAYIPFFEQGLQGP